MREANSPPRLGKKDRQIVVFRTCLSSETMDFSNSVVHIVCLMMRLYHLWCFAEHHRRMFGEVPRRQAPGGVLQAVHSTTSQPDSPAHGYDMFRPFQQRPFRCDQNLWLFRTHEMSRAVLLCRCHGFAFRGCFLESHCNAS